ncbi:putative transporter ESBP6 [Cytospora mali]|uniref:Transporter ESBP6 n=1 Tax=Cytospora mali TaxID=578113 RepID=A0A194V7E5_CYTMA|nr:putative transporter ESBP6 [Valsa mali var. pyri (nom. inval.)]
MAIFQESDAARSGAGTEDAHNTEKTPHLAVQPESPSSTDLTSPQYYPQDGGLKAWLFLIGACIVEITAWGFPYCYGVFREYFFTHEPFKGDSLVSVGGMLSNGVLQISLPPIIYTLNNFPSQRKNAMWLGCLICSGSAIGAAFTTSASALIVCLGLLYGIGAGLLFAPSMHFMGDWFVKRKSFAYGIICGAGAAAGAGLPPVYTVCLNKYGYRATLVGWGLVTFVVTAIGLLMMQPRTPPEKAPKPTSSDVDFLRQPLFLVFLAATFAQALAHYGPSTYLPSIGADFGLTSYQGSLLVTLLNLAQAIGQPLQGLLADLPTSFYVPFLISTIGGGAISALLIWPWCRNLWSLCLFSLCYGATAGGFAVLRPRFAAAVVGDDVTVNQSPESSESEDGMSAPDPAPVTAGVHAGQEKAHAETHQKKKEAEARQKNKSMLIFGVFTAMRGVAIISSGFITVALVHEEGNLSGWGDGTKWRNLMIYTGVIMTAASLGALAKFVPCDLKFKGFRPVVREWRWLCAV